MSLINILSPHVADMIAAGEVVERPASVIKELMENAFDAGARNITVEIRNGGATYIRVTDDGCGMSEEDAGVAFLRHATSKLRDEAGLEAISTMGFRGEALAAISSVSKIELRTRRQEDATGTYVYLVAGEIREIYGTGCPAGTTMVVSDLFYNTPARLKFLKSDRSEASACQAAALRCALARPDVSVRFIKDGDEAFFSPGDGRADSCVYTLLGREAAGSMIPASGEDAGLKLSGFVSSPSAGRGNRGQQYFFCNHRYIRSTLLQAALEQAYRNTLLTGKYPFCVLYLDIPFGRVDVNVHPAKTEVKFSDEKAVFDLVYYSALSALQAEQTPGAPAHAETAAAASAPVREPSHTQTQKSRPSGNYYQSMRSETFRSNGYSAAPSGTPSMAPPPMFRGTADAEKPSAVSSAGGSAPAGPAVSKDTPVSPHIPDPPREAASSKRISPEKVENSVQNVENYNIPEYILVGEAMRTYIICEVSDELVFIDKHAAHERMIFDRLKEKDRRVMSQTLLVPVTLRLSESDAEILEKNSALLAELGFEIEPYGASDYIVRALPADMDMSEAASAIDEICDNLRMGNAPDPAAARDVILHTVACKAAIKGGWDTTPDELRRIADAVLSGRVKYCPHGRPVSFSLTGYELEKQFKRIV